MNKNTWSSSFTIIPRVATVVIFAPRIIFTLIIRKIANRVWAFVKSLLEKLMLVSVTADTNGI